MTLSASDRAALEIGRLFLRAHTAEQQAEQLRAQLAEFTNGVERPKPVRKSRAKAVT